MQFTLVLAMVAATAFAAPQAVPGIPACVQGAVDLTTIGGLLSGDKASCDKAMTALASCPAAEKASLEQRLTARCNKTAGAGGAAGAAGATGSA